MSFWERASVSDLDARAFSAIRLSDSQDSSYFGRCGLGVGLGFPGIEVCDQGGGQLPGARAHIFNQTDQEIPMIATPCSQGPDQPIN